MRNIVKHDNYLLFVYSFNPYYDREDFKDWVDERKEDGFRYKSLDLDNSNIYYNNSLQIKNEIDHYLPEYISEDHFEDSVIYAFIIGEKREEFYYLDKKVFNIEYDFAFHKDFNVTTVHLYYDEFRSTVNIIRRVSNNVEQNVYVSNTTIDNENTVPFKVYEELVNNFPDRHHLRLYSESRIEILIGQYLNIKNSKVDKFEKYLKKKELKIENSNKSIYEYELMKYQTIYERLQEMFSNESISESEWQNEIIEILPLIYPKYVVFLKEVSFKTDDGRIKRLDYLLIDADGFMNIVELKKPFSRGIISENPYRDNHYPLKELAGSIMQIEKYLYYLSRRGNSEEKRLSKKYAEELNGRTLKIINPKGIIIAGRSDYFTSEQKIDFEIIKRKYNNIVEIITYDDLLNRLRNIIKNFEFKLM